ncbi:MAG: hypothetical protein WB777_07530 [Mycobacterium sp.]
MVAFWDVLALVLLLVSIAFLVLTVVLIIASLWTKKSKNSSDDAASRARTAALGIAGLVFLTFAGGVFFFKHPTLDVFREKSDALTAIGTVSGDVVTAIIAGTTLYALILLRKAVSEQVKQLTASAVQNVGQEMLKIDRWMADNPSYLDAVRDEQHTPLGAAVAEVHADLIDQVVSQATYLPPEYMNPWERYFNELICSWPQLEKFLDDHRHWYGKEVVKFIDAAKASDSAAASGDPEQQRQNAAATP